jgi:hypothetical protein
MRGMPDGLHNPVRFYKLAEHIPQKIFGIDFIGDTPAK